VSNEPHDKSWTLPLYVSQRPRTSGCSSGGCRVEGVNTYAGKPLPLGRFTPPDMENGEVRARRARIEGGGCTKRAQVGPMPGPYRGRSGGSSRPGRRSTAMSSMKNSGS